PPDPHAAEAASLLDTSPPAPGPENEAPLTWKSVGLAWAPYALMSVLLMLTGLVRQMEGKRVVKVGPVQTNYMLKIPGLDGRSQRDGELHAIKTVDPTLNPVDAGSAGALVVGSPDVLAAV